MIAIFVPPDEPIQLQREVAIQQEIVVPVQEIAQIEATTSEEVVIEEVIIKDSCYCSRYARQEGVDIPRADAIDLKASTTPEVGGGILFEYGNTTEENHIAVIRAFLDDAFFVQEANKEPCKVTTRIVSFNDPFIRGFINKK